MLSSHNHVHAFSPRDTILFYTSMSFDISVAQVWSALTSGATLAIASQDTRKDPAKLGRFMREAGTTISYMTPTQFSLLLEHNSEDVRACSSLRHAILAGEAVPTRLVKAIYDLGTPITIFNQYGPSEATCQTTFHKVNYPKSADFSVPIGHGMKNCSHYIVDNNLKPVPAYVTGELCIGGAQVGAGYLNRPEATDEVFVEDPFASEDFRSRGWTKLYRTGDKARFLADGQLDFKGRISGDKQIKLRGYRIDLAEIENELHVAATALQGPRLLEVVVLPRHLNANDASTADERQLIAFLVLSKHLTTLERQILVNALHKAISVPLNVYMRPSGYQLMDTLPKLISGKIDRQMLLQKRLDLTFPSSSATPSFKEAESTKYGELLEIVTQTFKTLLKLPANHQVSDTDNFFEVGGHSVLLLRLKGSLKTQLNVDITLIELFEEPTVIGITKKIIKKSQFGGKDASIAPILDIEIDWNAETILPNDSRYQPRKGSSLLPRSDLSEVVVTGADSFSGIHMLQELLFASPSTTVYAMPSEKTMSLDGLAELFEQWNLFNGEVTKHTLTSRVKLVQGSLIMPHFGLDENQFTELGQKVQAIYHVGGQISLLKSYTELKRANVGSVLDLIELASHGRTLTEIHYLSTWSVAHLQSWSGAHRTRNVIDISENSLDHFRPSNSNKFGYFKSRWVAEMLLGEASRRNFPVTIYRASAIAASTSSALAPPDDNFTNNMVLDMIATGKVPSFDNDFQESRFSIDFIPMDYLASTVVRLSTNDTTSPLTLSPSYFHISNPSPLPLYSLPALISQIRTDGKPGQSVPVAEWVEQMRECAKGEKKQLEWAVFKEYLELGHRMFSLDGMKAREAVGRINVGGGEGARRRGVKCPPVDAGYLRDMMARRRRSDVE